jgi:hypothetical protein
MRICASITPERDALSESAAAPMSELIFCLFRPAVRSEGKADEDADAAAVLGVLAEARDEKDEEDEEDEEEREDKEEQESTECKDAVST